MIMTQETSSNASTESEKTSENTATKQRKRRKWDQPAEPLLSCSVPINTRGVIGISQPSTLPQNALEIIQKLNQAELVAREIVINDAETNIRHKLTKRQTQDEIMKNTGAVVITRGKYQPQGSLSNGEKPLYLHISAGSHIKDMAERIIAVDKAASMIEEIIKQGQTLINHVVYLGFNADPSLNIASRIKGPNDQYINHIINETGANVLLRGHNSGYTDTCPSQDSSQPLHLYISSTNPNNLVAARILAENLLDTIALECGASRIHSSQTYSTIPPTPPVQTSPSSPVQTFPSPPVQTFASPPVTTRYPSPQVQILPPSPVVTQYSSSPVQTYQSSPVVTQYSIPPVLTSGTQYSGYYQQIYPLATPLQQVALALKQASPVPAGVTEMPACVTATQVGPTKTDGADSSSSKNGNVSNKRSMQKRKFKELPVSNMEYQNLVQGSEFKNSHSRKSNLDVMPPPKRLVEVGANGNAPYVSNQMMPPHPQKNVMPLPPVPKFNEQPPKLKTNNSFLSNKDAEDKLRAEPASDTLLKLVEYGEDDDDDE